jgi:hypothetical protein
MLLSSDNLKFVIFQPIVLCIFSFYDVMVYSITLMVVFGFLHHYQLFLYDYYQIHLDLFLSHPFIYIRNCWKYKGNISIQGL